MSKGAITLSSDGDFRNTFSFFEKILSRKYLDRAIQLADLGVQALSQATPVDSGSTASSWGFEITQDQGSTTIYWTNSNINGTVNIAVILQYGHGTGTGGYVQGRDYINPAMDSVFEKIINDVWDEVISS